MELVKVNVAEPAATAVMVPALLMVATAALLLTQEPPLFGVMVVVLPWQRVVSAGWVITGLLFTMRVTSLLSRVHTLPVSLV